MDNLRQVLDRLRTEVDKGVSRLKDADARSKKLLAMIKERDHELNILRERVDLTRRILAITKRCDEIQSAVTANNDNIRLACEKTDKLKTRVLRLEVERDKLEKLCQNMESQRLSLETQVDDLF